MEKIKLVIELLRVVIWPTVVFVLVLLFRNELKNMFARVREVSTPWGPVKISDSIEEIKRDIKYESTPELQIAQKETPKKPVRIDNVIRGLDFEHKVISLLGTTSKLFNPLEVRVGVGIKIRDANFVFDAFASSGHTDYIIEIKGSNHSRVIDYGKNQLSVYINECKNIGSQNKEIARNVKGILIVPDCDLEDFYTDSIAILKYDTENNKFVNEDLVLSWIKEGI